MITANQVLNACESTNDLAKKLGEEGAPHGSWISARIQTAGRGRMGRQWLGGEGNLFFSMVLRPARDFPISATPLCVAIALFDSIQKLKKIPELKIKWPNDLVLEKKTEIQKVAGILCEGVGSSQSTFIVAGVGVNCEVAPNTDQATASLSISADDLRTELVLNLQRIFEKPWLNQRGVYEERALLRPGTPIVWCSTQDALKTERGAVDSYGEFGELCVVGDDGKQKKLYSEEVKVRTSAHLA